MGYFKQWRERKDSLNEMGGITGAPNTPVNNSPANTGATNNAPNIINIQWKLEYDVQSNELIINKPSGTWSVLKMNDPRSFQVLQHELQSASQQAKK